MLSRRWIGIPRASKTEPAYRPVCWKDLRAAAEAATAGDRRPPSFSPSGGNNGDGRLEMSWDYLLRFANLFCSGILAGVEIVIHYGLHPAARTMSDQAQVQLRQALVLRLRVLVPAFFLPTAVTGVAVAILDGAAPGFGFRCVGVFALSVWVVIRVIGTVPINSASLAWKAASPPADWKALVEHAERFHIVGVWAAVLAFGSFLAAAAAKLAPH
jgi:hypothetical protein